MQVDDQTLRLYQLGLQAVQILVIVGGFAVSIRQFRNQTRAQLLNLYQQVFTMIDAIRDDRHYIARAEVDRLTTFEKEKWVDASQCAQDENWKHNRGSAERVFRSMDQLGLLIREGRVPIDAISRFYVRPILQAWYKLGPYVKAVRRFRHQPSHGWEFENLVYDIILPGLGTNRGVWKGVEAHDFQSGESSEWLQVIRDEGLDPLGDRSYKPPRRLWAVLPWYRRCF